MNNELASKLTDDQVAFVEAALIGWDGYLVVDANSTIIEASVGAAGLFGHELYEMQGMVLATLLPRRTMSFHAGMVAAVIKGREEMTGMGPSDRSLAGIHSDGYFFELHLDRCWLPDSEYALAVMRKHVKRQPGD